jgi:hypothetical protein
LINIVKLLTILLSISLQASTPQELVNQLSLSPAKKAILQWERVFKSERKMKRYKIDTLTKEDQIKLKRYLLDHAADSDQPKVAGD